jgi:cytoskeletal protein RodZ
MPDLRIDHTNPKNRSRTGREEESSSNEDLSDSQETFADREADGATATDAGHVVDELKADTEADAGAAGAGTAAEGETGSGTDGADVHDFEEFDPETDVPGDDVAGPGDEPARSSDSAVGSIATGTRLRRVTPKVVPGARREPGSGLTRTTFC